MTDAPEKIWAKEGHDSWGQYGDWYRDNKGGGTAYTRTDIAQAKIAELENALAASSGTIAAMRADRLADLPDMIAPLVWDYRGNVSCTAHTPFGKYLVETCHEDGYGMWTPRDDTEDDPTFGYHYDIHKGIDAANAHYADAIISEMRKPHGVST